MWWGSGPMPFRLRISCIGKAHMKAGDLVRRCFCLHVALCLSLLASFGAAARSGGFPREVAHAFGTTQITAAPSRIVTIGWSSEDMLLALGIIPAGMTRYSLFQSGILPWAEQRLGSSKPALLSSALDFEAVAALHPDLIIGVYSGIDAHSFQRLSMIAPTIVYRSGPWQADWTEQAEIIGETLGRTGESRNLVQSIKSDLHEYSQKYPALTGKTFTFGTYFAGSSSIVVYLPTDPRVAILTELGLRPSAGISQLASQNPGSTSVGVSLENIQDIDADILLMWYGGNSREGLEDQPLFKTLKAVRRSSYVALTDPSEVWSTSALTVLSIPYGFPRFLPRLAEAAANAEAN